MRVRGSSPAVRVAAVATAAIAVVYVIGAIVVNLVVARHMTQQYDDQLSDHLTVARHHPDTIRQAVSRGDARSDLDADSAPVFVWAVNARREVAGHSPDAPGLPPSLLTAALAPLLSLAAIILLFLPASNGYAKAVKAAG